LWREFDINATRSDRWLAEFQICSTSYLIEQFLVQCCALHKIQAPSAASWWVRCFDRPSVIQTACLTCDARLENLNVGVVVSSLKALTDADH
jgi:hypothetical protein